MAWQWLEYEPMPQPNRLLTHGVFYESMGLWPSGLWHLPQPQSDFEGNDKNAKIMDITINT